MPLLICWGAGSRGYEFYHAINFRNMRQKSFLPALVVAPGHPGVDRCLKFMINNFHRPIQLKDLVKISRMSRRGFCKAFNKSVGMNPGAVLRSVRIEHAKLILTEHDFGLKQIAERCGYRSENTFCVAFQRAVGIPPKKFQRQYWLGICRYQEMRKMRITSAHNPISSMPDGNFPVRPRGLNFAIKNHTATRRNS